MRLFDYGVTDDGVWYYAMELLHGRDLGALVERDGPMPIDAALGVVAQIAGAPPSTSGAMYAGVPISMPVRVKVRTSIPASSTSAVGPASIDSIWRGSRSIAT